MGGFSALTIYIPRVLIPSLGKSVFIVFLCLDRAELREGGEEGYLRAVNLLCEVIIYIYLLNAKEVS